MSKKFEFVLDKEGVRELLRGSEMQSIIKEKAERVQTAAGSEYQVEVKTYQYRVVGNVKTTDWRSIYHNHKNNTLLKALKAGK